MYRVTSAPPAELYRLNLQISVVPVLLIAPIVAGCTPAPPSSEAANGQASDSVVYSPAADDEALDRLTGYFHIVWGEEPRYWIIDDGEWTELHLSDGTELPTDTPRELVGRRIVVAGNAIEGAETPAMRVVSIELDPEDPPRDA